MQSPCNAQHTHTHAPRCVVSQELHTIVSDSVHPDLCHFLGLDPTVLTGTPTRYVLFYLCHYLLFLTCQHALFLPDPQVPNTTCLEDPPQGHFLHEVLEFPELLTYHLTDG